MYLEGLATVISSGVFKTKNGKDMMLVNLGEESTFTSYKFVGSAGLTVPQKGVKVKYRVNLTNNKNYVNVFLVSIEPIEGE